MTNVIAKAAIHKINFCHEVLELLFLFQHYQILVLKFFLIALDFVFLIKFQI